MKIDAILCDKGKLKELKALLTLYRQVLHGVSNQLAYTDDEYYVTSRKHLSDIVDGFIVFEDKKKEDEFYDRIFSCHETLELLKLFEKALVILKDYPKMGDMYYQILERLYFDNFSYTNEEIMEALDLPRTTYYRYLKAAYGCFYYHLIGVLGRENKPFHEEYLSDDYLD